jgi:hypothetical protein
MKRLWLAVVLCVIGAATFSASASAAPGPAWSIVALPFPTSFEAGSTFDSVENGPAYQVQAFNMGGAPTSGTFTITDTLPGAMEFVPGFAPTGVYGPPTETTPFKLNCTTAGRKVTCTSSGTVGPGEGVFMDVPVTVDPSAAGAAINRVRIEGGGATAAASANMPTTISTAPDPFGFLNGSAGLFGFATNDDGSAATAAGSHPYQATVSGFNLPTNREGSELLSAGRGVRDVVAELPRGAVVNPQATPFCTEAELHGESPGCPANTQIGVVSVTLSLGAGLGQEPFMRPLFNMQPPPGYPAAFAFEVLEGIYVHLLGSVRSDGTFELSAASKDILAYKTIVGVRPMLWGDPSDESHDAQRGKCVLTTREQARCPVERTGKAFVTMPSSCGGPLTTKVSIESWLGAAAEESYESKDLEGNSVGVDGCSALQFEPTIAANATADQGESPSGLDFDLHQTQHEGYEELATANLKDAIVTLPEGMVLNPSAANGRDVCSTSQVGYHPEEGKVRFYEESAHCPAASKLGTVEVTTPLLKDEGPGGSRVPHVLKGAVYLAKPFDNPFDSLLGIYLVVEDEETSIIAKLAGRVTPDATTGRLTTSFEESPELPLEDVKLNLYDGSRAALTTPLTCGTKTTTSTLTPWSTPEGADAHPSATFQTEGGCYGSEAAAPKSVSFTAGTISPLSGAYSPFVLRLARPDGSQHITGVETTLPAGLLGKLAGVSYCPESDIAQAVSREKPEQGKVEQQSPSCPSSSEVGSVNVTAGSGSNPFPVSGHVYLAGPYKGAPLSLVVIVPAVAGPFDLGTVVDRVALNVGEYDARIHAVADPLPTIREGIPLDVRSIELKLDRPSFTLNPTSCEAMQIEGSVSTQAGQSQSLSNRFQVGECGRLAFRPKLQISLKGATGKTGHPALKAVVTYPKEGAFANIARAQVNLPHSEFLDQGNIAKACTKVILAQRACPAKSIYGKVKAWTPLLEKPLEGPVYLVGGYGYKLPALVAELDGQIRVLLVGKVDSGKNHGIRNTFEAVPDAAVSRFVLEMKGGKKYGLFENSENICKKPQKAGASFRAQNGRKKTFSVKIANSCKGKGKGKK